MLTRRLTLAAFAALFAATSSLAMLQSPASAAQHDRWQRTAHHNDHDRDDRNRHRPANWNNGRHVSVNDGRHLGWNNPHNPHNVHYHAPAHRKVHTDPWRDRR
ncbi:MAG: hypothetical protein QOD51_2943 [Candidatus Eremiobacteraeota bacterium]|jgi:hypothetical protein|nr:hypothetical protein [Candidatus Eremiobacteraeota bacterium]